MNTEAYISSGILELYAAGVLSAAEKAEVEEMARQFPEVQAELDVIITTLDAYAALHAVEPPQHLKHTILNALQASSDEVEPAAEEIPPVISAPAEAKVIPFQKEQEPVLYKWLVAAAIALLVLSNALSFYFYNNWKKAEQQWQLAVAGQQQYAQNLELVRQELNKNQEVLAVVRDPATRRIELKGGEKSPDAKVTVYWHQKTNNVLLEVNNLPEVPTDRQYQLWALIDGKPLNAGLLNVADFTVVQQMKNIDQAQAFAITLEPKGGSINPTLDQLIVMGNI